MNEFRRWEEFALGPGKVGRDIHVTLDSNFNITLGARAARRFGIVDSVVMMFDKWNKIIGIVPAKHNAPNAFPLIRKPRGEHRVIRARSFCRYYGIQVVRTTAIKADINAQGVLELDLKFTRLCVRNPKPEPLSAVDTSAERSTKTA
jgi:hypothetical protein